MKKFYSLKSLLVGTTLMLGVLTAFGQTKKITISNPSIGGQSVLNSSNYDKGAERVWVTDDISFGGKAITGNIKNTPSGHAAQTLIQAQGKNGVIYNTTPIPGKIVSISINSVGATAGFNLFGGSSTRLVNTEAADYAITGGTVVGNTSTTGWDSTDFGTENYTYFAIKNDAKTNYISSIVVEYEDVAACILPEIVTQPTDVTVKNGESATFSVNATGDNLEYQWQLYDEDQQVWMDMKSNETVITNSLNIPVTDMEMDGLKIRVVVSSGTCQLISNEVILTIIKCTLPEIVAQPTDVTVKDGESATFSVNATGENLEYQWQFYDENQKVWIKINETANTLNITATDMEMDGLKIRVVVSSGTCQVISNEATLIIEPNLEVNEINFKKVILVKNTIISDEIIFGYTSIISIFNMNGQVVKTVSATEGKKINVATLAKGMYIVRGVVNGKKVSQKIIKK